MGAARRAPAGRRRGGRRARQREHGAHRAAHAVRPRAQPDRRRAARVALRTEQKFQIARRVVGAEQQYITYNEFLPALGVQPAARIAATTRRVNPSISERVRHRRLPGAQHDPRRVRADVPTRDATRDAARSSRAEGDRASSDETGGSSTLVIPLGVAFFNPDLVQQIGLGPVLAVPRRERAVQERRADRQLAAQRPLPDPEARGRRPGAAASRRQPGCFSDVVDLGALDIAARPRPRHADLQRDAPRLRAAAADLVHRDHGRERPTASRSGQPRDRRPDAASTSPRCATTHGDPIASATSRRTMRGSASAHDPRGPAQGHLRRRWTSVDAFVGMVAEPHVRGPSSGRSSSRCGRRQFAGAPRRRRRRRGARGARAPWRGCRRRPCRTRRRSGSSTSRRRPTRRSSAAGLEPLPGAVGHRAVDDRDQAAERLVDAGAHRHERGVAVLVEAHHQLGALRRGVHGVDGGGVERRAVVGEQQLAQRLAHRLGLAHVGVGERRRRR